MDRVVRQFAQRVVAIHAAALVVLLVVVGLASREIYQSAHEQALAQAEENQALIAAQTARGIEGFYNAILAALQLISDAGAEPRAAALVARQMEGRASHVFVYDREHGDVSPFGHVEPGSAPATVVAAELEGWMRTVGRDRPLVSAFHVRDGAGYNALAVPAGKDGRLLVVAIVPVRAIESRLLDRLERDATVATVLVDDASVVMGATQPKWIGQDLRSLGGTLAEDTLGNLSQQGFRATKVMPEPFDVGGVKCPPSVFATEPINVADERWFLLVASDLRRVDAVVTGLVRRGIVWVIIVVVSMTALLVSTSVHLIRNRIRQERERARVIEAELAQARQIQLAWLPDKDQSCKGVDVAAVNLPASHISGDFYNWFALPDGRTAVVIGDVTGHGMAAAFLMATVQLLVRNTLPQTLDPGRCMEEVNRQLCVQVFAGQFVTMQVLVIDCDAGKLSIANAGHPPPLVSDGESSSFQPLSVEPQLVLGIEAGVAYPTQHVELAPGACMLLYTDGVPDAVAADGKRFEADGLQRSIVGRHVRADALVRTVTDAVTQFRAGRDLVDDLTLVAVRLQPSRPRANESAGASVTA